MRRFCPSSRWTPKFQFCMYEFRKFGSIVRAWVELTRARILDQVPNKRLGGRRRNILVDAERLLVFFYVRDVLDHVFSNNALHRIEKDAVAAADYCPCVGSEGKTEPRSEIFFVDREDRARQFDAGAPPTRRFL